jgi:transposase-like protein
MCPKCHSSSSVTKRGIYKRVSDNANIQRFHCKICQKSFSSQTHSYSYRLRKRDLNQMIYRLLCKGSSQRGCAQVLGVTPRTIARRVPRFGKCSLEHLRALQSDLKNVKEVIFDEMESFEHTKLKPLTIPLAVENNTRLILAVEVGRIAAKGPLASISRKKYGVRKCERKVSLERLFENLKSLSESECIFKSDQSYHYPPILKTHRPDCRHITFKGRKAAVVGQGEMKKGGFDPLFSLNQTAAMLRDNIKRLTRKTWCTTKRVERLLDFLNMYAHYHNQIILGVRMPYISNIENTSLRHQFT